ncbi:MAG: DUF6789 family protein [Pseudomonadota bacterium]
MARALFASMIATAVVSILMYLNVRMDFMPAFDILVDIARFNERLGLPFTTQAVWVTHGIIGVVVLGSVFAIIEPVLPGRGAVQGMWFGVVTWLAMMVAFMPLAQHEIFAQDLGAAFIAFAFALNLVYGAILGMTYFAITSYDD